MTADHQTKNARYFERAGAAICIPETDAGRAPELARSLLGDERRLAEMSLAMRLIARHEAADEIADALVCLATDASPPVVRSAYGAER